MIFSVCNEEKIIRFLSIVLSPLLFISALHTWFSKEGHKLLSNPQSPLRSKGYQIVKVKSPLTSFPLSVIETLSRLSNDS